MTRKRNLFQVIYPDDELFDLAQQSWSEGFIHCCIARLWESWDRLLEEFESNGQDPSRIDWMNISQRERALASLQSTHIQELQSQEDPFTVSHEVPEMESLSSDRAMPPAYDFAFQQRGGNRRVLFPVEAKYLADPSDVSRFCSDASDKYLSGKGSPFSSTAVLMGYLLSGEPQDCPSNIESKMNCSLVPNEKFRERPHWNSEHRRSNAMFLCHWLICGWH